MLMACCLQRHGDARTTTNETRLRGTKSEDHCVPCYLVAHDSPAVGEEPSADDKKLTKTLSGLGGRSIQRSVWLIRVKERDAKRVISGLRPFVDSDLLWVSEVNSNYGYNRALTGTNSWLLENGV